MVQWEFRHVDWRISLMEKKDNAGLYLKDDYKTRDAGETFTVGELWPHFLEQGGTSIIRFNSN